MKQLIFLVCIGLISTIVEAKEEEYHTHEGKSNIKLNYEILDFTHSLKKEEGKRYGIEIDHENRYHHYQLYYEKTNTDTTKIVPKDLNVKKYTMKYQYKLHADERVSFAYIHIDDNLMKETNGGDIYGVGYLKSGFGLTQYISDYPHFNVYQTDMKYTLKSNGIKWTALGKYIHLSNKNSNNFSKKAKTDYFTAGLKVHTHYRGYHLGAGVFVGKRIFAVMKEGFRVQHHAMEFKNSYMCGVGHEILEGVVAHIRYTHHEAKEVPMNQDNVKVDAFTFDMVYSF